MQPDGCLDDISVLGGSGWRFGSFATTKIIALLLPKSTGFGVLPSALILEVSSKSSLRWWKSTRKAAGRLRNSPHDRKNPTQSAVEAAVRSGAFGAVLHRQFASGTVRAAAGALPAARFGEIRHLRRHRGIHGRGGGGAGRVLCADPALAGDAHRV